VGTNVGTAAIGRRGCFLELVPTVCIAIIALEIHVWLAEWLSASGVRF
jgi:hypothetical protein